MAEGGLPQSGPGSWGRRLAAPRARPERHLRQKARQVQGSKGFPAPSSCRPLLRRYWAWCRRPAPWGCSTCWPAWSAPPWPAWSRWGRGVQGSAGEGAEGEGAEREGAGEGAEREERECQRRKGAVAQDQVQRLCACPLQALGQLPAAELFAAPPGPRPLQPLRHPQQSPPLLAPPSSPCPAACPPPPACRPSPPSRAPCTPRCTAARGAARS